MQGNVPFKIDNVLGLKSLLAGLVAVMLGIGGGFILVPMMLEMKQSPKTAAATSNFLIIYSSTASTILYALSGQLNFEYGFIYGGMCGVASYIGNIFVTRYIRATGKSSVLILMVLGFVGLALILLPLSGINKILADLEEGNSIVTFNSFC